MGPPAEPKEEPPLGSPAKAAADEATDPLRELTSKFEAPLELVPAGPRSGAQWWLVQARSPVVAIEATGGGWSLSTVDELWDAAIRRIPRRLGWHLEVTSAGAAGPALFYYPFTMRAGGWLKCADDGRYKLRRPVHRAVWTLATEHGEDLADIGPWKTLPDKYARARAMRPGLKPAASEEPNLPLLLAVTSLVIVMGFQQPSG